VVQTREVDDPGDSTRNAATHDTSGSYSKRFRRRDQLRRTHCFARSASTFAAALGLGGRDDELAADLDRDPVLLGEVDDRPLPAVTSWPWPTRL